ncbi:metal ABC transporter solute-binding protein, Zn/Mn family [Vaginisenegalia massiliensis]|uniref:metal ABC transporter solute-binding protein, Zn/Mn family n=1 Tax=Vaginisenegalia massiliensis TaxID=2058294 RepID=UPI000F54B1EE|nr:zinc ABC transporter substrate-binding protein [Vaginisenegalia massiliensis]
MKKSIHYIVLACLVSLFGLLVDSVSVEASKANKEPLRIVTSFYPMYAITKEIVGDKHPVYMINSSMGIHGFEPSANDVAEIYQADLFIYHSVALESWTKNIAKNAKSHPVQLIEASQGLDLMKVQGLEDMESVAGMASASLYDPHTWLDPIEAGREATLIANHLAEIDPNNADFYQQNAKSFNQKAKALVDTYHPIFAKLKNKTFITQHTAFSYLAKRFGLKQLGIAGISSEVEPSSKRMAEIQQFIQRYQVKTLFVEPNANQNMAKTVAKATGVKLATLSPLESDPQNNRSFLDNLASNIQILAETLQKEGN